MISEFLELLSKLWSELFNKTPSAPELVVVPPPTPDFGDLPHPDPVEPVPKWLEIAKGEIGVHETLFKNNKRILEYHMATSLSAREQSTPWCSSFACWCLAQAGVKSPASARARDFLKWGYPLDKPKLGCIVVLTRGDNDDSGHVGLYIDETSRDYVLLSGNTHNSVCISLFAKSRLLGIRWPSA